ncbi:hypothetical protein [Nonomuraea sp. LPB2021202275-12-8]|uniref:hypothetical protein n=1 Tax=Nonomuraea sp. LPB2021202275-12-8 TaxID=3120159 RepID=UPI00300CCF24
MARTDLTPVTTSRTGLAWAGAAANVDGHAFGDNGRRLVRLKNTDAAARTVTVPTAVQVDGLDVEDLEVTIPATTGDVTIGPFTSVYRQPNGKVHLDYSAVAGLSVQLIEYPAA